MYAWKICVFEMLQKHQLSNQNPFFLTRILTPHLTEQGLKSRKWKVRDGQVVATAGPQFVIGEEQVLGVDSNIAMTEITPEVRRIGFSDFIHRITKELTTKLDICVCLSGSWLHRCVSHYSLYVRNSSYSYLLLMNEKTFKRLD